MTEWNLPVEGGKYRLVMGTDGRLSALRHNQPWRDLTGDNLVLALAQELREAREEADRLRVAVEDAADDLSTGFALDDSQRQAIVNRLRAALAEGG